MAMSLSGDGTISIDGATGGATEMAGTARATTSGTSIDFPIPSWAKRITLSLAGVSTNGASIVQAQLGTAGGIDTSGYAAVLGAITGLNAGNISPISSGFPTVGALAANTRSGALVFTLIGNKTWACQGVTTRTDDSVTGFTAGSKALTGALTTLRLTTVNGTDAFDAGLANVLYE